jgi:hypothetical protein
MTVEGALSTLTASTGNYLVPTVVDPVVRDYIQKATPILNLVTRVSWPTQTYYIRKRTALPTATWSADGGSLPTATMSQYTMVAKPVKFLYTRGEVTGPLIAASGGVVNALQTEIQIHSAEIAEKLATDIISADGSPAEEIEGMLTQIPATAVTAASTEGGTLDVSARNPKVLTLAMLDEALDMTKNEADVILCSPAVKRKISALLQSQQRFNDTTVIGGGFRVKTYDGVAIVSDAHWNDDTQIIFYRVRDAKLLVNQDFTYEPLAKTKDSEDFFIKAYVGFALEGRPVLLKGFTLA